MTMISPSIIKAASITIYTGVQREGEFIITFPGAYHAGFNHGFNCAESLNFAVESWISRGLKATFCECSKNKDGVSDSVHIDMAIFLKNYREYSEQHKEEEIEQESSFPVPSYELDHFESGSEDDEPISITIALPGAKKSIGKKKKKKRSLTPSRKVESNDNWYSIKELSRLPKDQIPSTKLPSKIVKAYTS